MQKQLVQFVEIELIEGKNLDSLAKEDAPEQFVEITLGQTKYVSNPKKFTSNPSWDDKFFFKLQSETEFLFTVYEKGIDDEDELMCNLVIPVTSVREKKDFLQWFEADTSNNHSTSHSLSHSSNSELLIKCKVYDIHEDYDDMKASNSKLTSDLKQEKRNKQHLSIKYTQLDKEHETLIKEYEKLMEEANDTESKYRKVLRSPPPSTHGNEFNFENVRLDEERIYQGSPKLPFRTPIINSTRSSPSLSLRSSPMLSSRNSPTQESRKTRQEYNRQEYVWLKQEYDNLEKAHQELISQNDRLQENYNHLQKQYNQVLTRHASSFEYISKTARKYDALNRKYDSLFSAYQSLTQHGEVSSPSSDASDQRRRLISDHQDHQKNYADMRPNPNHMRLQDGELPPDADIYSDDLYTEDDDPEPSRNQEPSDCLSDILADIQLRPCDADLQSPLSSSFISNRRKGSQEQEMKHSDYQRISTQTSPKDSSTPTPSSAPEATTLTGTAFRFLSSLSGSSPTFTFPDMVDY